MSYLPNLLPSMSWPECLFSATSMKYPPPPPNCKVYFKYNSMYYYQQYMNLAYCQGCVKSVSSLELNSSRLKDGLQDLMWIHKFMLHCYGIKIWLFVNERKKENHLSKTWKLPCCSGCFNNIHRSTANWN